MPRRVLLYRFIGKNLRHFLIIHYTTTRWLEYKLYLGITFDSALNFDHHVDAVISKSLKILGFIRRSTVDFRSARSIISLYKSLVLPSVTYGSVIWSPFKSGEFIKLESIQHKLLRYCSLKTNHPLSFMDHNFGPLMELFQLDTIRNLFKFYDHMTVYKIIEEFLYARI